jgi:hypothetical protein
MSFSDLVHRAESAVEDVLLPRDSPSDTREVAAIAEQAAKTTVTLEPALESFFETVGSIGNEIETLLSDLANTLGALKEKLAELEKPPPPPVAAADSPAGSAQSSDAPASSTPESTSSGTPSPSGSSDASSVTDQSVASSSPTPPPASATPDTGTTPPATEANPVENVPAAPTPPPPPPPA